VVFLDDGRMRWVMESSRLNPYERRGERREERGERREERGG
jgi:hypothetical protein